MDRQKVINKSTRGLAIVLGTTGVQYVIALAIQMVLARLLEPENFGAFAFANIVVMFFATLTSLHGEKFLIKEKDDLQSKLNNIFTLELTLSGIFIVLILWVAPYLLNFLGKPEITTLVQFLIFALFYGPLSRPKCLFEKELSFWKARFPSLCAQVISGVCAITLAYMGYGVWSLIASHLIFSVSEIIIIWAISPYRPHFCWDPKIIRDVAGYGMPLLGSSFLIFLYWNVDYYIVGDLLGPQQLGYYWFAFQTTHFFLKLRSAIFSVVYPAFTKIGNSEDIKYGFEKLTKITAVFYMIPTTFILMMGEEIITFLFGAKWIPATTPFQILMVLTTLKAVTAYWDPIILYKGKTKIQFYMTIYGACSVSLLVYVGTLYHGIIGAATGILLAHIIGITIMGILVNKYVMSLSFKHLLKPALHYSILIYTLYFLKNVQAVSTSILFIALFAGCSLITFLHMSDYFKTAFLKNVLSREGI